MNTNEILTLFDYNYWANERILTAARALDEAAFAAPAREAQVGASFGSLRGTLVHILGAEWTWRMRCHEAVSPTEMITEAHFPALSVLELGWQVEEAAMRAYLGQLRDEDLGREIAYHNRQGKAYVTPLWQILIHVVNHGTQFRSEAAMLLTQAGHSPGDLDFIFYLREK
jgi:uncharacterized damage-inducible protein DinB